MIFAPISSTSPTRWDLFHSLDEESPETLARILRQGLDPNAWLHEKGMALAKAARLNRPRHVAALLAGGAHVQSCDLDGVDALSVAAKAGSLACCALLLEAGAAVDGSLGLFSQGADPYPFLTTDNGPIIGWHPYAKAPVQEAASRGHADILRLLRAHGAHFERHQPGSGYTPLILALMSNHPDAVAACIECGADPHFPSINGRQPGIFALRSSRECMAELCASPRFNPHMVDPTVGQSLLSIARGRADEPASQELVARILARDERDEMADLLSIENNTELGPPLKPRL